MTHIHALDTYRPGVGPLHRMDARAKFVASVAFIVSAALTPEGAWPAYILLCALALSVGVASSVGMALVQKRSAVALLFALAAVTVVFTTPGRALIGATIGPWRITMTDAGLTRFVSIVLKAWVSVQMAVILTATTAFPALLAAMRSLRLPKVLVGIFGFTYRYMFVIADEAMRLMRARAARSGATEGRGGGSLLWRAHVTGAMAGSLFLRSLERSERIYAAMVARGYDGEVRTLDAPALSAGAACSAGAWIALLALIQWMARVAW